MASLTSVFAAIAIASASLYDLEAVDINGNQVSLKELTGNVSIVMNVATF